MNPESTSSPSSSNDDNSDNESNTSSVTNNTNNSNNINDNSNNTNNVVIDLTTNQTIIEEGLKIENYINESNDASYVIHTIFTSTEPEIYDPDINQNLKQSIIYDDVSNTNALILNEIKDYASKINCSDFHGKGTIDDYSELFKAASKIANESKQIQLDVDVEGFDEFSRAAEELSNLFESFTLRLQNVNIINDYNFLVSIKNALEKIWNLSEVFGRFKQTILTTTTIHFPKSAHETAVVLQDVMGEIHCAMNYISHFVDPSSSTHAMPQAELSNEEKNIIARAVDTIDNWNIICDQGVNIAMNNNPDIQAVKQYNDDLKATTNVLKQATNKLRTKLNSYMNM
jgi:hypothetical protein